MGTFAKTLLLAIAALGASAESARSLPRGDPPAKQKEQKEGEIPFERYGRTFLQTHCKAGAEASACPLEQVRSEHYVHGVLGVFDFAYPAGALSDKERVEDLRAIAKGLLGLQEHWIAWLAQGDVAAAKADVATLAAWVQTWKPAALQKAKSAADKDLFALLQAGDEPRAAAKRLSAFLLAPASLGVAPTKGEPVRLLFAPRRIDFIELAGYAGLADPAQRPAVWVPSVAKWTSFWLGWDLVLALEYPPWKEDPEFKTGLSMNKYEATGMVEHVVQQATLALLWACYGESDSTYLQQSFALNMAIAVCGEGNALEGDGGRSSSGGQTAPYEKFVPGGNSAGGFLPPIPAGSQDTLTTGQWREGRGADHFAAALRKGQKNGQKLLMKHRPDEIDPALGRDNAAHFMLLSEDGAGKHLVSAPFFGKAAKEKAYPPFEFLVDYREFFRAYRTAFFHWLQTQGDPAGAEESAAKYRTLMKKVAAGGGKGFEDVVQDVYGLPISGKNGQTESLEWRFLGWLAKGK